MQPDSDDPVHSYGDNVFSLKTMRNYLSEEAYTSLLYGSQLASRAFGPELAAPLEERLGEILERLGPQRAAELRRYEELRVGTLVHLSKKPT